MDRWDPVKDYIVKNDIKTDIYGKWDDRIKRKNILSGLKVKKELNQ